MTTVHIAYATADQVLGNELIDALRAHHFKTTADIQYFALDKVSLEAAQRATVATADAVVFIVSRASVSSDISRREIDEAVVLGKPVVPILVEPIEDVQLHGPLRGMYVIRFFDESGAPGSRFDRGLEELIAVVSEITAWRADLEAIERAAPAVPAAQLLSKLAWREQVQNAIGALAGVRDRTLPPVAAQEDGNQADASYDSRSEDWKSSEATPDNPPSRVHEWGVPYKMPPRDSSVMIGVGSPIGLLRWVLLAAAVGLGYYLYGDKLVAWVASWFGGFSAAMPPLGRFGRARKQKDRVDCSLFSPPVAAPGKYIRVQIFLHRDEQFRAAQIKALALDAKAALQDRKTLKCEIARGAKVDIEVRADDDRVGIRKMQRSVTWEGDPTSVDFFVKPPEGAAGEQFFFDVLLFSDGQPIGELGFMIECRELAEPAAPEAVELGSTTATRYEKIFLSYSSKDRRDVSLVAQSYDAVDQDFFMDILKLSAGERWERQLYKKIDECDLFMLFWSENARTSVWVRKETEYALEREADTKKPRFLPFPLEGPPPPEPWASIKDRHIGSPLYYLLARNRMETAE